MEDKIFYIGKFLDILFLPYVCLLYDKKDIQEIYSYKTQIKDFHNDDEIIETKLPNIINYKNWNKYNLYSCFHRDYETIKIFRTIIAFYDEETQDIKRDELKIYFDRLTETLIDILKNNILNINEFKFLRKKMKYVFKLFPTETKNKIFNLYPLPSKFLYELEDAILLITDCILTECKKINGYKDNMIWKVEMPNNLSDHDKNIVDPIIDYIKKNPQCVDVSEFQNDDNITFDKKDTMEQNEEKIKDIVENIEKDEKFKINEELSNFISINIRGINFLLVWLCYVRSTAMALISLEEVKQFLISKTFFSHLINNGFDTNKIKESLSFGLYTLDLTTIVNKLKNEYPKKYKFLGYTQTIVQPFSLFKDFVRILTKENGTKLFYKLFKLKDSNNNKKILYFIKKNKEINPIDFIQELNKHIKKSSKYLVVAINNSIHSLNQTSDYEELGESIYPMKITICNKDYKLETFIMYHDHHYESCIVNDIEQFKDLEELKENTIEMLDFKEWKIHMLIYKQIENEIKNENF